MKTKVEIWRPAFGFEDRYEVSNFGSVRTLTGCIPTSSPDPLGYMYVSLFDGTKRIRTAIHRLVLMTFVGPPCGLICRHLNGNPSDNRLKNLRWGTHLENGRDRTKHQRQRARLTYNTRHPEIVEVFNFVAAKKSVASRLSHVFAYIAANSNQQADKAGA